MNESENTEKQMVVDKDHLEMDFYDLHLPDRFYRYEDCDIEINLITVDNQTNTLVLETIARFDSEKTYEAYDNNIRQYQAMRDNYKTKYETIKQKYNSLKAFVITAIIVILVMWWLYPYVYEVSKSMVGG